ncbi:MAG TPA: ankyrin repeat domain-containing protein [Stellaceae bacterium]|nr:ankyrin repeat domain-containing protein [Stellaceae bacterium]
MSLRPVASRSPLSAYERQAEDLLAAHRAGDPAAIDLFHSRHPRFLDEKIKWRPKFMPASEIRNAALSLDDARLTVARFYEFADWATLAAYVERVAQDGPFFEFESAVEAVVNGDLPMLEDALRRNPGLIGERSSRLCFFDPPVIDTGENPDRYNPEGTHGHATPLHQAALAGHGAVVRLLVERGARLDIRDTVWNQTPLGWALHGGKTTIADYLRSAGATG